MRLQVRPLFPSTGCHNGFIFRLSNSFETLVSVQEVRAGHVWVFLKSHIPFWSNQESQLEIYVSHNHTQVSDTIIWQIVCWQHIWFTFEGHPRHAMCNHMHVENMRVVSWDIWFLDPAHITHNSIWQKPYCQHKSKGHLSQSTNYSFSVKFILPRLCYFPTEFFNVFFSMFLSLFSSSCKKDFLPSCFLMFRIFLRGHLLVTLIWSIPF